MADPTSTWGDLEPFYSCANCQRKANDLQLCQECKIARYCNDDCRSGNRAYHEKYCHPTSTLPWGETPVPTLTGPIDPSHPSNPLRLRAQPVLSPEALNALRSYDGPPPPEGHTWGQAKLTAELKKRPDKELHFRAEEWFGARDEKRGELLCREKSKEELVRMLREWVYARIRTFEEDKAVNIAFQTYEFAQNVDELEPADLPKSQKANIRLPPAMEIAKQEMDGEWESDKKGKPSGIEKFKQKAKDVLHLGGNKSEPHTDEEADDVPKEIKWMIDVPMYMGARAVHMTHYGSWLHKSLLEKLPSDPDCTRFAGSRLAPVDNEIAATLLELQVPGIDEGTFWELEDTVDVCVLTVLNREQLNKQGNKSWAKISRRARRYGIEDKIQPPDGLKEEAVQEKLKQVGAEENILVRE